MSTTKHTVFLDRLDWANPSSWYQFPTLAAAQRFAAAQARLHPQRAVVIQPHITPGVQNLNTTTSPTEEETEMLECEIYSSPPLLSL